MKKSPLILALSLLGALPGCDKLDAAKDAAEKAAKECAPCAECKACLPPPAPTKPSPMDPIDPPGAYPGFTWKRCGGANGDCAPQKFIDAGYSTTCATPNTACYPDGVCRAVLAPTKQCHPGGTMTCMKTNGSAGLHTCAATCDWNTCQ